MQIQVNLPCTSVTPRAVALLVLQLGGGTYLNNMMIIKSCTSLSISQGMALTDNKFFDLSTDKAAKLLFFSKEKVFKTHKS
jgi:hypothetical protein